MGYYEQRDKDIYYSRGKTSFYERGLNNIKFDLVEFGSPIEDISNLVTIGTFLSYKLANGDKSDDK